MHAKIKKRDGRLVKFNAEKITNAIAKAGAATGEFDLAGAKMLTIRVLNLADKVFDNRIINVEEIQDIVEEVLFLPLTARLQKRTSYIAISMPA